MLRTTMMMTPFLLQHKMALSDEMGSGNDISSNLNHNSSAKNVEDHNDEDFFSSSTEVLVP
jgi:hypothetical protein